MHAMWLLAFLQVDVSEVEKLAIQHEGRIKPFDTFAREMMRHWTGKEKFEGVSPVASVLDVAFRPEESNSKKLIRILHPDLKKQLGLPEERPHVSVDELSLRLGTLAELRQKAVHLEDRDRTPLDRAVLELAGSVEDYFSVQREEALLIVPVEVGENRAWMSPLHVRRFLASDDPSAESAALRKIPRAKLEEVEIAYDEVKSAFVRGDRGAFAAAAPRLSGALRELNPSGYPARKLLESEVRYNHRKPFTWAAGLYALTFLMFLFSAVFSSRLLWGAGVFSQVGALGVHLYAYFWRWEIAQRFPLSNQYEAMLAIAFLGALIALIFECVLRSKFIGLAAGLVGAVIILLADAVTDFSPYIHSLAPALQSIWMTIHVPTILMGYVCGAILAVLGHIYIFTYLWAPRREETLKRLDTYMYRILQVTILFLLAGVVLGGVWAKEAWGRFWGWDMKETWALITLLSYLATLHARFAGAIKGLGTAVCSLFGVIMVFLTFYGVNYIFGRGLHAYGFGSGSTRALIGFCLAEAAVAGAGIVVLLGRRRSSPAEE